MTINSKKTAAAAKKAIRNANAVFVNFNTCHTAFEVRVTKSEAKRMVNQAANAEECLELIVHGDEVVIDRPDCDEEWV